MKNKLINIFMLVSFMPLALFAAGTSSMKKNSKVILSGNILANSQVVPVGGQAKTVMASGSGKIRFSSTRFCGDGDVADYHDRHPATEFYDSNNPHTNIVVGYWVSPQGGPLDVSANKFVSLGYVKDSKIDADVTEKLIPTNYSTMPPKQTFELIKDAVKDIAYIAETTKASSVQGLTNTKFNMKFVAMACPVIKNTNGVDSNSGMNNLKITRQFITGNNLVGTTNLKDYMQDSILDGNASISKTRVRVDAAGSASFAKSIDLSFGGGGGDSLAGELTSLVNDLAYASKPSVHSSPITLGALNCSCDRLDYSNDLSSLKARFNAIKARLNAAKNDSSICDVSSSIRFDSADYPWESFRTNAACQVYHKLVADELTNYENAIEALFNANDVNKNTCNSIDTSITYASCPVAQLNLSNISDNEFRQRKMELNKKLMKIVGTPNAIQVAQSQLKSRVQSNAPGFALNTASCFPLTAGSGQFIQYISSSVGIQIAPDPAVAGTNVVSIDPGRVSHPEGNFAIGGDAPYLTADGNSRIIFNNGGLGDAKLDTAFKVEIGMSSTVTLTTGTANAQFHIRSIGCSQNIYCLNDR